MTLAPEVRRDLFRRLKARHGEGRALDILNGNDPATNRDLAAWRGLGDGLHPDQSQVSAPASGSRGSAA